MRLSDLFRDMDLATLGVASLLLVFGAFLALAIRTLLRRRATDERLSRLPLDDDPKQETRP